MVAANYSCRTLAPKHLSVWKFGSFNVVSDVSIPLSQTFGETELKFILAEWFTVVLDVCPK